MNTVLSDLSETRFFVIAFEKTRKRVMPVLMNYWSFKGIAYDSKDNQ